MGEKYDEKQLIHDTRLQHGCLLEILPKSSSPWVEAACNESDGPGFELERAFGCGSCSSQSAIDSVCEFEEEHDQSLVNLILYYDLKSDFARSPEKKTENQRGGDTGGGGGGGGGVAARRVDAGDALCFEIHPDQMEMEGVEEPTATNGYPHRLLSEEEEEAVYAAGKEDLEDEAMSLFYEFRDLPHVGEDALQADDDVETAIPLENRSTETKFTETDRTTLSVLMQNEDPLTRINSNRKRAARDYAVDQDGPFDRHFLLGGSGHELSLATTRPSGFHRQRDACLGGTRAGHFDMNFVSSAADEFRNPPEKRPRYSLDANASIIKDESNWNNSNSSSSSSSSSSFDPGSNFYDDLHRDPRCSKFLASEDRHGVVLDWIPTGSEENPGVLAEQRKLEYIDEDDYRLSSGPDARFNVSPYDDEDGGGGGGENHHLWNGSSSLQLVSAASSSSATDGGSLHFGSDVEFSQLVAPSIVFPPGDSASSQRTRMTEPGEGDATGGMSLESFIASFIETETDLTRSDYATQDATAVGGGSGDALFKAENGQEVTGYRNSGRSPGSDGLPCNVQHRIPGGHFAANVANGRPQSSDERKLTFAQPPFIQETLRDSFMAKTWSRPHELNQTNAITSSVSVLQPPGETSHYNHPPPLHPHPKPAFADTSLPGLLNDLPFPLPSVPAGYQLVITHRSLPSGDRDAPMSPTETRIIIIHPSSSSSSSAKESPFASSLPLGVSEEESLRNTSASRNSDVKYQQVPGTEHQYPTASGVVARPVNFEVPWKPNPTTNVSTDGARANNGGTRTTPCYSAPSILDLSLSSTLLPRIQNPPTAGTISIGRSDHGQGPRPAAAAPSRPDGPWRPDAASAAKGTGLCWAASPRGASPWPPTTTAAAADERSCVARRRSPPTSLVSGGQTASPATTPSIESPGGFHRCLHPTSTSNRPSNNDSMKVPAGGVGVRGGQMDDVFPPNVVVFSPQKAPDHEDNSPGGRSPVTGGPQQHRICPSSASSASSGHSSPLRSVEPDSTVHPGHTEATRDIIRAALGDKIRRNRSKQRLTAADSLVSTTSSPDRPSQSPANGSGHGPNPGSVDGGHHRCSPFAANPPKQEDNNAAVQHSVATTGPSNQQQQQLHSNNRRSTPSSNDNASSTDKTTTTSSRKTVTGSQLQLTSYATSHSTGNRSRGNDEPNRSKDKMNDGMSEKIESYTGGDHLTMDSRFQPDSLDFDLLDRSFFFFLDAPISTVHRQEEDKITYLNKGQYYRLSLECQADTYKAENIVFRSVVMVLFRDSRAVGDELEAWKIWHSRQQSYKQRILDIDYKDACGVGLNSMNELAYNATALTWSPADQPVRVNIAVNCLSTDFSNQKGVKGIPLHIQIDTYDASSSEAPICRAYCKIKVFCDKGAERKVRDEERKRERKNKTQTDKEEAQENCCSSLRQSNFYPVEDEKRDPILFTPSNDVVQIKANQRKSLPTLPSYGYQKTSGDGDECSVPRRPRAASIIVSREFQRVLLYVREVQEEVFTALLLQTPTLSALAQAIHEKCNIDVNKIKNIYKKSKKGILVKMDEKILRHYSNESTFILTTATNYSENPESVTYDVILAEIDVD